MNSRVLACLLLVSLVASSFAVQSRAGPFCSLCTKMIGDIITKNPQGFANMTTDELDKQMDAECDANTSGMETTMCKNLVKQDDKKLLAALQAGKNANDCCVEGSLC